jgi:small-conductance mechanosensitive channel
MATPAEKIQSLTTELEKVVEQHNQAVQVMNACREQAISLQGAINALRELEEEGKEETTSEAE